MSWLATVWSVLTWGLQDVKLKNKQRNYTRLPCSAAITNQEWASLSSNAITQTQINSWGTWKFTMPAAYSHLQFVPLAMNSIKFFFFFFFFLNKETRDSALRLWCFMKFVCMVKRICGRDQLMQQLHNTAAKSFKWAHFASKQWLVNLSQCNSPLFSAKCLQSDCKIVVLRIATRPCTRMPLKNILARGKI